MESRWAVLGSFNYGVADKPGLPLLTAAAYSRQFEILLIYEQCYRLC